MSKKAIAARVHDARLVNKMAEHLQTSRPLFSRANMGAAETTGTAVEMAGLVKAANLVTGVQKMGYSQEAAYALLGQGIGRSIEKAQIENGATGKADQKNKDLKIKSDGRKKQLLESRRRKFGMESTLPEDTWDSTPNEIDAGGRPDVDGTVAWFNPMTDEDGWVG